MPAKDSTLRFSNRVTDYVKYRPGYPVDIVRYLEQQYGLTPGKVIADVGAGTGISSALFLEAGYEVYAIEPNAEMRDKAIELLGAYAGFHAVDGTAEVSVLADDSVDAIIAGQAFHWFDAQQARTAFQRMLKPGGVVALIWNERLTETPFEQAYEELIVQHGNDYVQVEHRNIGDEHIGEFFSPKPFRLTTYPNQQVFDFEGLKGRLLSSSYMPAAGDPRAAAMVADLRVLFDRYQENNTITIHYLTKLYTGLL